MTDTTATALATNAEESLLAQLLVQVASGEITLTEAALAVRNGAQLDTDSTGAELVEYVVPEITDAQRVALAQLPSQYGLVVPESRRQLTEQERTLLMQERLTIAEVLSFIEKRKDETIRETLHNHFDKMVEEASDFDPDNPPPKSANGHYVFKQEASAPGTGKKFNRNVVKGSAPRIDSAALEAAHLRGDISRADYLAITKTPDVKRVFDETKARKAIKQNPGLLASIAAATTPAGTPTTSITVTKA